ncbi:MORN motif [Babesia duncani]|uniref:MORN motif n=1 Tax=Babesia duncani TaxID=323732 RepID=A0AAD9UN99_9APIC|nr:MORN motif [Babesia duncani]
MGQAPSVSADAFHEEYYMFFDSGKPPSGANSTRSSLDLNESKHSKRMQLYGNKLVSRNRGNLIYEASTNIGTFDTNQSDCTVSQGRESIELENNSPKLQNLNLNDFLLEYREERDSSGRIFKGHWKNNEMIKGQILWPDGSEYQGSLLNGEPHGYGIYKTNKKSEYRGYWHQGLQHGEGMYITNRDACPLVRRGVWNMGKMNRENNSNLLEEIINSDVTPASSSCTNITATPTSCTGHDIATKF